VVCFWNEIVVWFSSETNNDLQLGIFNKLFLNKYISDVFTEILINLIQHRLRLLEPKIIKYKRPPDKKVLIEEFEEEETIPLIKLKAMI